MKKIILLMLIFVFLNSCKLILTNPNYYDDNEEENYIYEDNSNVEENYSDEEDYYYEDEDDFIDEDDFNDEGDY